MALWPAPTQPLTEVPALPQTYLGIDPSLTSTGIAVVREGKLAAFALSTPKKGPARLDYFYDRFLDVLDHYAPSYLAIEGYAFGARNSQSHALGELGGVLRLALWRSGLSYAVAPPTTLKTFAAGKGNVEKSVVAKELFKRFGVDLPGNDEVDASGLAIVALASSQAVSQRSSWLTVAQIKTLEKIEKVAVQPVAKMLDKAS
jgi:crossover junction endodeoxyribonuclease RuvC